MHLGMGIAFQALEPGRSDADIYANELARADQAEARGFDSVWTPEHHFDDYIMSPHPLQFLTWMAGRTKHIQLGSMVVVIPWHDPVRVAEQVSVLDHMSGGRVVLGLGRGLGAIEFDGFRLEMGESRRRFVEYAGAISEGLETGVMEFDGELYQQPRIHIRPKPAHSFAGRIYASAVSPESAKIMARLGVGLMVIAQKPWETTVEEVNEYRDLFCEVNGHPPPRPIIANFTVVHRDADTAAELQAEHGVAYARSVVNHYEFTNPRLAEVPGYEYYAALREKIQDYGEDRFAQFLAGLQIVGTPEQIVEETIERVRAVDAAGVINVFGLGGMPEAQVRNSLDTFVDDVLPTLKQTDAFRDVGSPQELVATS